MGKKSPSAPVAPDPAASVQAQAEANRISQFTPQGNLIFGNVNEGGDFTAQAGAASRTELTPFQEQLQGISEPAGLNLAQQLAGQNQNLGQIDLSGLPSLTQDFSADRGRVEQSQFDRGLALLEPGFAEDERRLETTLVNQGIPRGSEAFTAEQDRFDRSKGSQLENLALSSVGAGGAEQSRLAQLGLATRQAGLGEQSAIRGGQISELAGLLSGNFTPQQPTGSFFGPGQIDVLGPQQMQFNAQQSAFNAANQRNSGNLSALAGLGSAAIFASDRRLKRDIELIGEFRGLRWYTFKYLWSPLRFVGVMAQEVLATRPDVVGRRGPWLTVDYGAL